MTTGEQFLFFTQKQFHNYKELGEKAMKQISDEKLFFRPDEETNSIAMIIQHMSGNMLSRWTDLLITDGEKDWRNRDREFEVVLKTKDEVLQKWGEGWNCLFSAMAGISADQLSMIVLIRNEPQTLLEAINRQIAHYAYHIGQIVYVSKQNREKDWQTLSIARQKNPNTTTI